MKTHLSQSEEGLGYLYVVYPWSYLGAFPSNVSSDI